MCQKKMRRNNKTTNVSKYKLINKKTTNLQKSQNTNK